MQFQQAKTQFLIGLAISLAAAVLFVLVTSPSQLESIQKQGKLTVVTINNPVTFYEDQHGATGFEYELVKAFAEDIGVDMEIITVDSKQEILEKLDSGEAQLAAANLTVNGLQQSLVDFTTPYDTVTENVVYRYGNERPRSIEDMLGKKILVLAGSSHSDKLGELKQDYPGLEWSETAALDQEGLLTLLQQGIIDYAIVDSNVFEMYRPLFPDLVAGMALSESVPLAWAVHRNNDGSLKEASKDFLNRMALDGSINRLKQEFFAHVKEFNYVQSKAFLAHIEKRLPRYIEYFQQAAERHNLDWRLLAAMAYQESHWDPDAVSPTGVRGIMMLTKPTASEMGILDREDASESIRGGAAYFKKLLSRIPEDIAEPDRTWMALAAYNVGYGHVTDAKIMAEQEGDDPTRWESIKKRLPLLKKREFFTGTRHGYARGGGQSVIYVNHIRSYYNALVWATSNDHLSDRLLAYNTQ